MKNNIKVLQNNLEYKTWLYSLKKKVRTSQLKAAISVNTTLLQFYWELGADIVERQKNAKWGSGFLKQLSHDLMAEFPDMKGFSYRNIKYVRQWYSFYSNQSSNSVTACDAIGLQPVAQLENETSLEQTTVNLATACCQIGPQAVAQLKSKEFQVNILFQIPWGHNRFIVSKCKNVKEALFYVHKTIENNWSRSVLVHQIESNLFTRQGKVLNNFKTTLPTPQSDLAQQIIKSPYSFDFLTLRENYNERELEQGLIEQITKFLLELGSGFAYMGKQVPLKVGEREFFLDLLFYHSKLHAHIVIELKTGNFEPKHVGKLNFYIKAVDEQLKNDGDNPTIGILLCKNKDKLVAEYSLSDIHKPMGISKYKLTQSLPSVKEIEAEFVK